MSKLFKLMYWQKQVYAGMEPPAGLLKSYPGTDNAKNQIPTGSEIAPSR